jgi:hypothetical protein
MNVNKTTKCFTLFTVVTLVGALSASALADSDTKKRTVTGGVIGGAVVGVATGSWGWAAAGAAAGAAGGYLYDKNKKNEEKAYDNGVKDGQRSKSQ